MNNDPLLEAFVGQKTSLLQLAYRMTSFFSLLFRQEKSQCPFTAENGVDENSAQNLDAEAEKANCNTGEEPAKEREVWSEDKPDSVEVTADSASNESSQTDRDSVAEEPTDSKDSSKNTETSETVPSDSPSGPVEVPIESEDRKSVV